jgi:branched-chain amino acid transport system permease protein
VTTRSRHLRRGAVLALVVLLALAPLTDRHLGGLLPGPINSAGSLQLLALMFVAAATAVTLDVMFGYTGLLSFGHALYFGFGCYSTVILGNGLGFTNGVLLATLLTFLVALVGNAASLRLTGIGYSMATLALAQALYIGVERGFLGSGGEVGVTYSFGVLPDPFVGIVNTRNVYWLALALLVVVYAVCALAVRSEAGHVWQAIRENDVRTQVLGYHVYGFRLGASMISCTLAGICGAVYSVVTGGANPGIVFLGYSLSLVLMVVLGGRGVLWGAVVGGLLYTYLSQRLSELSDSSTVTDLPEVVRLPLTQPNFILGVLFILIILFLPGGLASIVTKRSRRPRPRRDADRDTVELRENQAIELR